jgi:hypothetical protein
MIFAGAKIQNKSVQNIANNNIESSQTEKNQKDLAMLLDSVDDVRPKFL